MLHEDSGKTMLQTSSKTINVCGWKSSHPACCVCWLISYYTIYYYPVDILKCLHNQFIQILYRGREDKPSIDAYHVEV